VLAQKQKGNGSPDRGPIDQHSNNTGEKADRRELHVLNKCGIAKGDHLKKFVHKNF
jgi:hypothetical protein